MRHRSPRHHARQALFAALVGVIVATGTAVVLGSQMSTQPSGRPAASHPGTTAPPPCWEAQSAAATPSAVIDGRSTSPCNVAPPGPGHTLPLGYESGVTPSLPDIRYGSDPEQLLDLYLPAARPAPVLVYFHSGGWVAGSRAYVAQSILHEVQRGYAVASVEYRLAPQVVFPVPLQDAKTAIRWVKANAAQFGMRADKVFAAGASAGGHLAAMVAVTSGLFEPTDLPPELAVQSSRVVAAVSLVGPLDLNALGGEVGTWGPPLVSAFLGCAVPDADQRSTCSTETLAAASPVSYVTRDDPPIYLSYGMQDALVPPSTNGRAMAVDYARIGRRLEARFDLAPNQGHNIDIDGTNITTLEQFLDWNRDGALQERVPVGTK